MERHQRPIAYLTILLGAEACEHKEQRIAVEFSSIWGVFYHYVDNNRKVKMLVPNSTNESISE